MTADRDVKEGAAWGGNLRETETSSMLPAALCSYEGTESSSGRSAGGGVTCRL